MLKQRRRGDKQQRRDGGGGVGVKNPVTPTGPLEMIRRPMHLEIIFLPLIPGRIG